MFVRFLGAVILLFAVTQPSVGAEIMLTPTQGSTCKSLEARYESAEWRCPGPGGYFVQMSQQDSHFAISFTLNKSERIQVQDDLSWLSGIGRRIEWHLADGRPYAAIFEISRLVPETGSVAIELVIAKVAPSGTCRIGTISARLEQAAKEARELADSAAPSFQCGRDKSTVKSLADGKHVAEDMISHNEVLDHGGSLMDLKRSDDGQVEIRYREPRAGVSVPQGTLLFQGLIDKAGKIRGTAYTFKPGCSPAPYTIEGERKDGVLLLSGPAPMRGRLSCAVAGYDASSANANLVFERDVLLSDTRE